ncbi:hypothetical protein BU15DRAFT_67068 [Melanogaster broomeanus]|nr:hypothetical protein BU15DRAFT_67068 [Melanogaster broomeanus]
MWTGDSCSWTYYLDLDTRCVEFAREDLVKPCMCCDNSADIKFMLGFTVRSAVHLVQPLPAHVSWQTVYRPNHWAKEGYLPAAFLPAFGNFEPDTQSPLINIDLLKQTSANGLYEGGVHTGPRKHSNSLSIFTAWVRIETEKEPPAMLGNSIRAEHPTLGLVGNTATCSEYSPFLERNYRAKAEKEPPTVLGNSMKGNIPYQTL